jgi:hypothetical protein
MITILDFTIEIAINPYLESPSWLQSAPHADDCNSLPGAASHTRTMDMVAHTSHTRTTDANMPNTNPIAILTMVLRVTFLDRQRGGGPDRASG